MPSFLRDGRFWAGVLAGYFLVVLVPSLSFKSISSKAKGS
jgi:hypothetical protein